MKKLLKIPALLFAIMLIVSSCGRSAKSDAETLGRSAKSDAETLINADDLDKLEAKALNEEDSKKKIKLYKEYSKELENFILISMNLF